MVKIKLLNVRDIDKLFSIIDSCEGKVELVGDDICLNLKSELAKYFSLAKVFSNEKIPELDIVTYNADDSKKIIDFLIYNN